MLLFVFHIIDCRHFTGPDVRLMKPAGKILHATALASGKLTYSVSAETFVGATPTVKWNTSFKYFKHNDKTNTGKDHKGVQLMTVSHCSEYVNYSVNF